MKQLPKYAFLQSDELEGKKVICLERPYFIANVRTYKRDDEYVSRLLEDMAQERYPIGKVNGYTIFLNLYTSLEPNNNRDEQQDILNEMAEWFYTEVVQVKTGTYMKSEESGKLEEKIVMRGRVMRERKNRIKKD
jgi:cellulose synthase/poly-beta-1,6-N-acetylglucosamine synthase-like glycosyltransferase